jgi:hypothetical protein
MNGPGEDGGGGHVLNNVVPARLVLYALRF